MKKLVMCFECHRLVKNARKIITLVKSSVVGEEIPPFENKEVFYCKTCYQRSRTEEAPKKVRRCVYVYR